MSIKPWSFSRIKAFEQCPKQFYHEKILKQYPVVETEAMRYGTEFHKAAEDFMQGDAPLDPRFSFALPALESLKSKKGKKLCERKMVGFVVSQT